MPFMFMLAETCGFFNKEDNHKTAKLQLNFNGGLAKPGLTSLIW